MILQEGSAFIVGISLTMFALLCRSLAFAHIRTALIILGVAGIVVSGLSIADTSPFVQARLSHKSISTFSMFFGGLGIGAILQALLSGQVLLFLVEWEKQRK